MTSRPARRRARTVALFDAYPHLYGGAQRVSHRLALDLRPLGWTVRFVLPGEGRFVERLRGDDLDVDVVAASSGLDHYGGQTRGRRLVGAALAFPGYARRLGAVFSTAGLVHAVDPRGILLAGPAARLARRAVIWQLHVVSRRPVINRLGMALARETVTVSRAALDAMPELRSRAEVIPNPLTEELLSLPAVRPGPIPTVVTVGRIHPDKGLDLLIAAMARVAERHPGARLVIIGEPQLGWEDYASRLRELGGRTGCAIDFQGWVERPAEHWSEAWVYVQASRPASESAPLAVREALACGLPVVATDVAGMREQVRPGETGLLVAPEDVEELARAIASLLEDRGLAARLAQAGAEQARAAALSPSAYAEWWASTYERLVGRR